MIENIEFECSLRDFRVVPYVRMTQKSKWVAPRALKYRKSQQDLAILLKSQGKGAVVRYPCRVEVDYTVTDERARAADGDNILKACCDALVWAGILKDDNLRHVDGFTIRVSLEQEQQLKIRIGR